MVLQIGNFMNYGSRTGGVEAFDIEALTKIAEFRCSDTAQKTTLMDFLQAEVVVRLFTLV